jgi:RNA polymerase sigma-70 factor (ECF subfamily)
MRMDLDDDDVLAERMRRGEHDSFAMLTSRYWTAVHRIARNLLADPTKAREVALRAFLGALRSPDWFPREAPFRVSLYRLTIILALIPSQPGQAVSGESLLPQFDADGRLVAPETDLSELAGSPGLAEHIREGLKHVDDLDRAAFVLRVVEEVPLDEAAAILEIPAGEIRHRAHRANLSLTGFLGRLPGAAERQLAQPPPKAL